MAIKWQEAGGKWQGHVAANEQKPEKLTQTGRQKETEYEIMQLSSKEGGRQDLYLPQGQGGVGPGGRQLATTF